MIKRKYLSWYFETGAINNMIYNLDSLFKPRSVAIIGASTKEYSIGNVIVKNLVHYGFKGSVYPVNPKAETIHGLKAFSSVLEIFGIIDLVHIVIPPSLVPQEVENCGKKGVKFIIINSAGFKEMGKEGAALETDFLARAKKYNIRILGPNCQGIINSDPTIKAYCNFTFTFFKPGHISIVAQSGGVGQIITQALHDRNVGIGLYASNGNACDISIPEIIRYYGNNKNTKVVVVCLESISNTKAFIEAAKEVVAKKPILAISAGNTKKGAAASKSHTGGLAGGKTMEVIFEKTGILSFPCLEELCNAAEVFASQPIPKGNRVGIITNTGGPAIVATDTLIKNSIIIPPLTDKTKKQLSKQLLTASSISNPLDILATADADHFQFALETMNEEPQIDSIYITFVTPIFVDCENIAKVIVNINKKQKKPIVCNLITDKKAWSKVSNTLSDGGVPCFDFPEAAANALASMVKYNHIKNRKKGKIKTFSDVNKISVKGIFEKATKQKRDILTTTEVFEILAAYKIPTTTWSIAKNIKEALVESEKIGYPIVVKAISKNLIHKSDVGGVVLNLSNPREVKTALLKLQKTLEKFDIEFLVQKYLPDGKELVVGVKAEEGVGHLLMFGIGGIMVEAMKDVVFNLSPVTDIEANEMLTKIKATVLLENFRGKLGVDKEKIVEIIQRISQLVTDFPAIKELDLNPILAFPDNASVVDARIIYSSK
jgi:acetate---CoA ligase (ADP-forming)